MSGVPAQDSLAMWRENNVDVVECVKCGHQMREADKEAREHVRKEEQVIGIFIPTSVIRRLFKLKGTRQQNSLQSAPLFFPSQEIS